MYKFYRGKIGEYLNSKSSGYLINNINKTFKCKYHQSRAEQSNQIIHYNLIKIVKYFLNVYEGI